MIVTIVGVVVSVTVKPGIAPAPSCYHANPLFENRLSRLVHYVCMYGQHARGVISCKRNTV